MSWAQTAFVTEVREWNEVLAKWREEQVCHTCPPVCMFLSLVLSLQLRWTVKQERRICWRFVVYVFFFFLNSNCLLSFGLKEEGVLYLLRSGMFEPVHMTVLLQPERVKLLLNLGVLVSGALNCSFCFFKYCRGILNRTTRFYLFFFLFFHLTLNINP